MATTDTTDDADAESTTQTTLPPLGAHVRDTQPANADSNTELIVLGHPSAVAGDLSVKGRTIAELNDCAPDTPVVSVVYTTDLDKTISDWRETYLDVSGEGFVTYVEQFKRTWKVPLTSYTFPVSRLTSA